MAELAALGALLALGGEALAVVGRPLTPVSYAGVARRTTRRAAYGGAAYGYGAAAVGTAAVAGAATAAALTALPPGCVAGVTCGGVVYRPVYQGTTVVYVPQ